MKIQNVILIDHTGKIIKNQLKLPYYNDLDHPVILLEGQEYIVCPTHFAFKNKLKAILAIIFSRKIAIFTNTVK
jgi:hypothetical protein